MMLVVMFFALPGYAGWACGVAWTEPSGHFPGVNYQGRVMVTERLADITTDDPAMTLPLFVEFCSHYEEISPAAGHGWRVPLLEGRMVQTEDHAFRMDRPDGSFILFRRDRNSPLVLRSSSGWIAELDGPTIRAAAPCGTSFVFSRGKLTTMQVGVSKLDIVFQGEYPSEIRQGSRTLLTVLRGAGGQLTGFRYNGGSEVYLRQGNRPIIQDVGGQRVVGGMQQTLCGVSWSPESQRDPKEFTFSIDAHRNPTLTIGERVIVWDAVTRRILRDGNWTYQVTPGDRLYDNAVIVRKNAAGQAEMWSESIARGEQVILHSNGEKAVLTWFTSGNLIGKVRRRYLERNGVLVSDYKAAYNASGKLIRETTLADGTTQTKAYAYDNANRLIGFTDTAGRAYALEYKEDALSAIKTGSREIFRIK